MCVHTAWLCPGMDLTSFRPVRCDGAVGACSGGYGGSCWPYHLWSGTLQGEASYYDACLGSGSFALLQYPPSIAFSVRHFWIYQSCSTMLLLLSYK